YKQYRNDDYKRDDYKQYRNDDYKRDDYKQYRNDDYKKEMKYDYDSYSKDNKRDDYKQYRNDDYKKEMKYDYNPYTKDNKHDGSYSSGWKCNANTININPYNTKSLLTDPPGRGLGEDLSTQQLLENPTNPPTLDSLFGGGLNFDFKNICANFANQNQIGIGIP
ncbi:MAG TPA: hypothetical protein VJ697_16495, partial [Nitrososphaeraceae archaeon]|nr:hypothetical protein [Nitrososphaeraceae archaeon]